MTDEIERPEKSTKTRNQQRKEHLHRLKIEVAALQKKNIKLELINSKLKAEILRLSIVPYKE